MADTAPLRATAGLGQVVSAEKVVSLPLNGRMFIALASLVPGVALPQGSQFPRINGGRPRTDEYLFDGISVLQPEPGQVAFFPVVDAIQEFKIETNSPPAEFGRFNGGVINLTTKAGTNALHGTARFFRHEALNARTFFAAGTTTTPEFSGIRWRRARRTSSAQSPVLLRGLPGPGGSASTAPCCQPSRRWRSGKERSRRPSSIPPRQWPVEAGGFTRRQIPGNTIPVERMDPVARACSCGFRADLGRRGEQLPP